MQELPFKSLRLVKAKDAGRIAFIDDAPEPSRAFSNDADLVRWLHDELRGSQPVNDDGQTLSADDIANALNQRSAEIIDLDGPTKGTARMASRLVPSWGKK
jgi:hypothetical protein